jgi:hypothetical protein
MEQLMHEVRRTALDNDLGMDNELASQTVLKMLIDGDEGERAFALALMEGDPGLAQVEPIAAAIRNPKSRFEQYHSLLVAKSLLDDGLDESGRKLLKDAADTALADSAYMDSPSRAALALSIRDGASRG